MEQSSQPSPTTPEPVTAPAVTESSGGDDALREELAKWRERVPKLAAALRQRAEETEALKQEVERLRRSADAGSNPSAGIRARDELIVELEAKLADLAERHKTAEGQLHAHRLEVGELKNEVDAWKGKWHSVTRSLDEQAAAVGQRDQQGRQLEEENERLSRALAEQSGVLNGVQRALDEAVEERDSLRRRNEQLFETTELANRQIGSLTDSLAELRGNLKQHRERDAALSAERDSLREELEALRVRHAEAEESAGQRAAGLERAQAAAESAEARAASLESRLQDVLAEGTRAEEAAVQLAEELHLVSSAAIAALHTSAEADHRVARAQNARAAAEQRLAEAEQARAFVEASLEEQGREVQRLAGVVEVAQRTTTERENERRELSERLQAQEARSAHLEQQLGERSGLVVALENDQAEAEKRHRVVEQERDRLEEALIRAERHVKENAEHVKALDDKLERQKELMDSLEAELAEAKEEQARVAKARPEEAAEAVAEVVRLQEQVRKLEALVRERTEALNRLEWRRRIDDAPRQDGVVGAEPRNEADEKLLLVLNQQLADTRARNAELLGRLRQLEAAQSEGRPKSGDDLTRIHGVGQKLAEQLNDLGIYRYEQIAALDETDLAEQDHVLHGHRGRIMRDAWIDQAVKLISH